MATTQQCEYVIGLRCFSIKKNSIKDLAPVGLNPKHLCKCGIHMYGTHAQNALNDPQGHQVQLVLVYNQFLHFCGINYNTLV